MSIVSSPAWQPYHTRASTYGRKIRIQTDLTGFLRKRYESTDQRELSLASAGVIADVAKTLKAVLKHGLTNLVEEEDIKIFTPDQMKSFSFTNPSVTIFLYHLSINPERRNSGMISLGNGKITRPPLPLDLRYLITPWVKDTLEAHVVCGYILRALYDNDSLGASDLVGDSWAADDTLQLVLESLPVDEHYDVWQPTGLPYRLSLAYLARVVGLDSGIVSSTAPVISAQFGGL